MLFRNGCLSIRESRSCGHTRILCACNALRIVPCICGPFRFPLVYLRIVSGSGCGPIRSFPVVGLVIRPLPSLGLHRTSAISSVILVNGLPSLTTPVSVCLGADLLSGIGCEEFVHCADLIEVLQDQIKLVIIKVRR